MYVTKKNLVIWTSVIILLDERLTRAAVTSQKREQHITTLTFQSSPQ
jgi:hypothetical protein